MRRLDSLHRRAWRYTPAGTRSRSSSTTTTHSVVRRLCMCPTRRSGASISIRPRWTLQGQPQCRRRPPPRPLHPCQRRQRPPARRSVGHAPTRTRATTRSTPLAGATSTAATCPKTTRTTKKTSYTRRRHTRREACYMCTIVRGGALRGLMGTDSIMVGVRRLVWSSERLTCGLPPRLPAQKIHLCACAKTVQCERGDFTRYLLYCCCLGASSCFRCYPCPLFFVCLPHGYEALS